MKKPAWMYSCEQATFYTVLQQNQKLTQQQKLLLRMHLSICKHCKRFSKQIGILESTYARTQSDATLSAEELAAMRQHLGL